MKGKKGGGALPQVRETNFENQILVLDFAIELSET